MVAVTPLWHRSGPLHPVPLITRGRETDRPPLLHKSEQTGLSPPFKKLASDAVKQIFKILTILVFLNVIRDRKCKKWICSLQESLAIAGNSREYEKW